MGIQPPFLAQRKPHQDAVPATVVAATVAAPECRRAAAKIFHEEHIEKRVVLPMLFRGNSGSQRLGDKLSRFPATRPARVQTASFLGKWCSHIDVCVTTPAAGHTPTLTFVA